MTITPQDNDIEQLALRLAALTGETVTEAIHTALAERLERERLRLGDMAARLREIGEHCASLPDFDIRTADEIVGYDDKGIGT